MISMLLHLQDNLLFMVWLILINDFEDVRFCEKEIEETKQVPVEDSAMEAMDSVTTYDSVFCINNRENAQEELNRNGIVFGLIL